MNDGAAPAGVRVGVLALQGGFAAHAAILDGLGADVSEVRTPDDLVGLDALVMPGGESTVMSLGIVREGLADPIVRFADTHPVLATCAGMIMLDRDHLGVLDITTQRNAFGRQVKSFETDLAWGGDTVHAVFIRAPWVSEWGAAVDVLAEVDGHPVAVRQGAITALAFHPELSGERRFHDVLIAQATGSRNWSS
ncbi:pyridoxal 5'-phosphate synthase glutaminase subunit PdxT [Conexibacter sp. DBS9H8]|uniref:pyridoxal 5'-phosphate synthase glutaminase subunit PdxT n=1 Tax=Conexibacter sp. DBS9H8 TaxID=2937801 RepID=UPI00200EC015|nr:pyridoxal 5'-phosphate synthase glutaminase subunit PdxT [Conexibacter sp. DBS9H8]